MPDIEINEKRVMERFKAAMEESPEKLYVELRQRLGGPNGWMSRWFDRFERTNITSGAQGVKRRSGALARDRGTETLGRRLNDLRIVNYFTSKYAPMQQFGGTVTPTKSQWLTVPLKAAKTASGVLRRPARMYEDAFVVKRGAKLFLARPKGEGLEFLFRLMKSVRIPGNLGFYQAWERDRPKFLKQAGDAAEAALKKVDVR